ncbi:MAG: rhamnogalacturonan acetylesterase [Bacteroidetes bacterium]|nr:MAG: rhamnogalacturonan acetylesterase [Bacteroidota bacterium]
MSSQKKIIAILMIAVVALSSFMLLKKEKPVFYIIGDSTVKNGDGTGKNNQMGWGTVIPPFFDTTKISVRNHAIGGRSSRTFITEGRWNKILETLKKGDYVIMQFGHNDASPLDDTARARGVIKGIGEDSTEIWNPIRKIKEVVHTYGWYMRKYVRETKAKGAIPIICSLVPRNNWKDNKVGRSNDSWALWAKQVAEQEGAFYIELNGLVADKYDAMGQTAVKAFFQVDNTHTNNDGAKLNAETVANELKRINPGKIKKYMN